MIPASVRARAPASLKRVARRFLRRAGPPLSTEPFGTFERDAGPALELWVGYRDAVKRRWRSFFWPSRLLLQLGERVELDPSLDELRQALLAARTLPVPLPELAAAAARAAEAHPDLVAHGDRIDVDTGRGPITIVPTVEQVAALAAGYAAGAVTLRAQLLRHRTRLEASRVLELGCGSGYATYAVAAAGAGDVVGVDIDLGGDEAIAERPLVLAALLHGDRSEPALLEADAAELPFGDGEFDVVFSYSALEHMAELDAVLRESARVLRRGGLAVHVVDPWLSPQGGHAMCILDAPWGHARLTEAEFERYIHTLRPHEERAALTFYRTGFQRPRRTLDELRTAFESSGFAVATWQEGNMHRSHEPFLAAALGDVRACFLSATAADLRTSSLLVVARRR